MKKSRLVSAILCCLCPLTSLEAAPKPKKEKVAKDNPQVTLFKRVLERADREDREDREGIPSIYVFLQEQELILFIGGETAMEAPVSTGRKLGWTPIGEFSIIGKSPNHRSSAYGKHVSKNGKVLRSSVDSRKKSPPPGGRFVGAPMPNFLRMTSNGIGIHAGELPGYPASHGCIRVPKDVSQILFEKCPIGTKVFVRKSKLEELGSR